MKAQSLRGDTCHGLFSARAEISAQRELSGRAIRSGYPFLVFSRERKDRRLNCQPKEICLFMFFFSELN